MRGRLCNDLRVEIPVRQRDATGPPERRLDQQPVAHAAVELPVAAEGISGMGEGLEERGRRGRRTGAETRWRRPRWTDVIPVKNGVTCANE